MNITSVTHAASSICLGDIPRRSLARSPMPRTQLFVMSLALCVAIASPLLAQNSSLLPGANKPAVAALEPLSYKAQQAQEKLLQKSIASLALPANVSVGVKVNKFGEVEWSVRLMHEKEGHFDFELIPGARHATSEALAKWSDELVNRLMDLSERVMAEHRPSRKLYPDTEVFTTIEGSPFADRDDATATMHGAIARDGKPSPADFLREYQGIRCSNFVDGPNQSITVEDPPNGGEVDATITLTDLACTQSGVAKGTVHFQNRSSNRVRIEPKNESSPCILLQDGKPVQIRQPNNPCFWGRHIPVNDLVLEPGESGDQPLFVDIASPDEHEMRTAKAFVALCGKAVVRVIAGDVANVDVNSKDAVLNILPPKPRSVPLPRANVPKEK